MVNSDREHIFVFGASGHAKAVIDIIEKQGLYEIAFLVDDDLSLKSTDFFGYPVIGGKDDLLAVADVPQKAIVAIGSNAARCMVSAWLTENRFEKVSATHPSAQMSRGVQIGAGTVVMAGVCINSDTTVGDDVIVNTGASVDHDCVIGAGVHLAPGSTLCGTVAIGKQSFVCAGATVIPNLNIGQNVIVGAGSTVIKNVPSGVTVVGNPAKVLKQY
jgi:sugar O-acyltransferase (sialic acid O-acetyltransferase NeuD family)